MYASLAQLKDYIGEINALDDVLLERLLLAGQRVIEAQTAKLFEVPADTTRYFSRCDVDGGALFFDDYLLTLTSVSTSVESIPLTDIVLHPRNQPPYTFLRLKANANWKYAADAEDTITVVGRWGYSLTPPADIVQVNLRLAAWMYRQKDSQIFDQTAFTEIGAIRMKAAIPADVLQMLEPYRRLI